MPSIQSAILSRVLKMTLMMIVEDGTSKRKDMNAVVLQKLQRESVLYFWLSFRITQEKNINEIEKFHFIAKCLENKRRYLIFVTIVLKTVEMHNFSLI